MITQKEEIKELRQEIKEQREKEEIVEEKLKKITTSLKTETKKQIVIALMAGFGFLIALVWRDFLQEIANAIIASSHIQGTAATVKAYVAIITTAFAVIGIMIITNWNGENMPVNNTDLSELPVAK